MKVIKPLVHVVKFDHGHINTPFDFIGHKILCPYISNFEDEEKLAATAINYS
jgi:hypothetical protein